VLKLAAASERAAGFDEGYAQALTDVEVHASHRDQLAASNIRDAIRAALAALAKRRAQTSVRSAWNTARFTCAKEGKGTDMEDRIKALEAVAEAAQMYRRAVQGQTYLTPEVAQAALFQKLDALDSASPPTTSGDAPQ
jgi:hypothetical protein